MNIYNAMEFVKSHNADNGKRIVAICAVLSVIGLILSGEYIFFLICIGIGIIFGFVSLPIVLEHRKFLATYSGEDPSGAWNKEFWKRPKAVVIGIIMALIVLPYSIMLMALFAVGGYFEFCIALSSMAVSNYVHVSWIRVFGLSE